MVLVGLTGGIGSGKSTVAAFLRDRGIPVIDVDALARRCVERGPVLDAVLAHFGAGVRAGDGSLDRAALAAIVFSDPQARRQLEALTHPCIRERIEAELVRLAQSQHPPEFVVLDHPLLVESGAHRRVDVVVVVEAPEAQRVQRLAASRGMPPQDAAARIASQATDAERRSIAQHVLVNDLDIDGLERAVEQLLHELRTDLTDRPSVPDGGDG